ncbi:MAG: ribbon-helix-helix domain-containing protein [Deltaproteobacteria bacterium]|nr:ribbon-helix-helix domain-containing protein [Deltaproteobacteria bacterium]
MSKPLSVRVSNELALKLAELSEETERPKSFHVQKALEAYLSDKADLQIALDRLHDTTDPIISFEDMRKELEL